MTAVAGHGTRTMTNVWCVRAEFGKYTDEFVVGGYAGIGWIPERDLSKIYEKGELRRLFRKAHPENTSPNPLTLW